MEHQVLVTWHMPRHTYMAEKWSVQSLLYRSLFGVIDCYSQYSDYIPVREFSYDDLEVIVTKVSYTYIEIDKECRLTCEWLFWVIDCYSQYSDYIPVNEFSHDDLEVIVTKVSNNAVSLVNGCFGVIDRLSQYSDYIPVREFSYDDLEVIVTKVSSNAYIEKGNKCRLTCERLFGCDRLLQSV